MANNNNPSFAVSVTPKVTMDTVAGTHQALDVIHEDIRRSLGGSGSVLATGGDVTVEGGTGGSWADGTYTQLTNSSNAGAIVCDASSDLVFIKHLGTLVSDGTASAAADTVQVKVGAAFGGNNNTDGIIAELKNGEAIVLPRPGANCTLNLASGSSHVNVEVAVFSS
jgi:hypothetical protein|tara:strand:- start:48 stop:548 length:501 start_codon:yes stop_codon:yes gene_type:complete